MFVDQSQVFYKGLDISFIGQKIFIAFSAFTINIQVFSGSLGSTLKLEETNKGEEHANEVADYHVE